MKKLLDLKGIITVLNTPFTDEDKIDLISLKKNVKLASDAGVVGYLVPAMASEVGKLNFDERTNIVKSVIETVNHKKKVIGGASSSDSQERLKIVKSLIDLGCDGVLVSIPFDNEQNFLKSLSPIFKLDPPFLMIQDWSFTGYGIPISTIQKLWEEYDAFRAIKVEVVPASIKYSEILELTEGNLHVSGGWAVMQIIEALDRGVHAFMPTGMHEIYTTIYNLYVSGKRSQAQNLFNQLLPVLAFSNQHLDISIHFFKRLLHAQGIYSTPNVRDPILKFDKIHEIIAKSHINTVIRLNDQIKKNKWV
jgi:dihydrodipicolinate synthase/N-acetylneuraminate lyase